MIGNILMANYVTLIYVSKLRACAVTDSIDSIATTVRSSVNRALRVGLDGGKGGIMILALSHTLNGLLPRLVRRGPRLGRTFTNFACCTGAMSFNNCAGFTAPTLLNKCRCAPIRLGGHDRRDLTSGRGRTLVMVPAVFTRGNCHISISSPMCTKCH